MNIFALNMTCARDLALSELMQDTLVTHGQPYIKSIRSITTGGRDFPTYYNGAGWQASMMKLSAMDQFIKDTNPEDNDFILSVDSDVVFCGPEIFEVVNPAYGIIGVQHKPFYKTELGMWGHMSGALIFIRADIARKMCDLTDDELNRIRFEEFKKHVMTENEDVVLSYLAMVNEAKPLDIGPMGFTGMNFEQELITGDLKSYYHLNYCPTSFLGMEVSGKWDLPHVLNEKRITL
jgi:hypothetical protein